MTNTPLFDPELEPALRELPALAFCAETLDSMRQLTAFGAAELPEGVLRLELSCGPENSVALTAYRPVDAPAGLPCLFWIHGGGMVIGDRSINDATLIEWCQQFNCVCVTVEYRLAPEAPYPAAIDDCHAGLTYVLAHADKLGIDASKVGVGGQSAGGGLAAALALRVRDEGAHTLLFQYLEYPMLDDKRTTASSQLDEAPMWTRESNTFAWQSYLAELYGTDHVPAYAAPARAASLKGLPPAYLCVGTADILRDEAISYASRLTLAGVLTELHMYAGAPHAFHLFPSSEVGQCGIRDSASWLRRQLAPGSAGTSGAPAVQFSLV